MDWSWALDSVGDVLAVGTVGYVAGVFAPLVFRLIGYVVDSVKAITEWRKTDG